MPTRLKGCDLLSMVLTMRPVENAPAPPSLGRAAHAVLLQCLKDEDTALAEQAHEGNGPRPFTVSSLLGPRRGGLTIEHSYTLRFTALTEPVAAALYHSTESGRLRMGEKLRMDEALLVIEDSICNRADHPWAGSTNYQSLSAPWLLARKSPSRRVRLRFASPTTFRSGGMNLPFPLPELVFGSLLERWNMFAPIELPAEARRFAAECIAVSRYELCSRSVRLKGRGLRMGAVGWVEYIALNPDRYWLSLVALLSEYALYAGAGSGTPMGLGQTRIETALKGKE